MCVNVNRQVGVLGADGAHEHVSCFRFQQAGHILNGKNVDALSLKLPHKAKVILQIVHAAIRTGHITGVA